MYRWMVVGLVALNSVSAVHAQSRGTTLWTISGAGAGFGVGLWTGLSAFDDAVNSDRKVWTSAIIGTGVGAVAGYLIGRARADRTRPSIAPRASNRERQVVLDLGTLEHLATAIRFDGSSRSAPQLLEGHSKTCADAMSRVNRTAIPCGRSWRQ